MEEVLNVHSVCKRSFLSCCYYGGSHLVFVYVLLSYQHIFVIAHIICSCSTFILTLTLIFLYTLV